MSQLRVLTVEDDPISAGEIVDRLGGCGLAGDGVADGQERMVANRSISVRDCAYASCAVA